VIDAATRTRLREEIDRARRISCITDPHSVVRRTVHPDGHVRIHRSKKTKAINVKSTLVRRAPTSTLEKVCKHGHPLAGDNLWINPNTGTRQCRTCNNRRARETYRRRRDRTTANAT
jgi:hypothetical protein